jgi:hypothetical protein
VPNNLAVLANEDLLCVAGRAGLRRLSLLHPLATIGDESVHVGAVPR